MTNSANITLQDRFLGSLLGLAVGDALGTTLEFKTPGSFTPLSDMVGGGPFGLLPGQWTDDTSMALCLAESLLRCGFHNPADQMDTYIRWMRKGHLSSNGRCFDIGNTVRSALQRYINTGTAYAGSTAERSAGNGSLMRLCPVVLYHFGQSAYGIIFLAGESSRTTHQHPACIDACRYFASLLLGALSGRDKRRLLTPLFTPEGWNWELAPLCQEIEEVALGSFYHRQPPDICGKGYVVKSIEAALWAFCHSQSFEEGALMAVNLGDDADTTGAIYGQLAGAFYGISGIPEHWVDRLADNAMLREFAEGLYEAAMEKGQ